MKISSEKPKLAGGRSNITAKKREIPKKNKGVESALQTLKTKKDYDNAMEQINALMAKGSNAVSKNELAEIRRLALLAQVYEKRTSIIA